MYLTLATSLFWLTAVGQSNCGPPVPCALTLGAFCLFCSGYRLQQTVALRSSQPYCLEQFTRKSGYNMDSYATVTIQWSVKSSVFKPIIYHHLLTVVSSMITCKLNLRVYDSLLVLLDAVRLYRVYRWLDTLPLYLYYELLILC